MDQPYKHRKLESPSTIRLIRVMRGKLKGDIACKIFQVDREKLPIANYQALSYRWGDQKPTRQIYLQSDGQGWRPFTLHESLWNFLEHIWNKQMFGQFFWADRLCLDQSDRDEIAQQVPLMGDIYAGANLVVVWLEFYDWGA